MSILRGLLGERQGFWPTLALRGGTRRATLAVQSEHIRGDVDDARFLGGRRVALAARLFHAQKRVEQHVNRVVLEQIAFPGHTRASDVG
jgi:hypothetical protein